MTTPAGPANQAENPLYRAIVRWRWALFALVALVHVLAFNGTWRIGRDTSLYREIARGMVEGHSNASISASGVLVLPGYPMLLAGMRMAFGDNPASPWPELLAHLAMAGLVLVIVYRLARRHFPPWIAVMAVVTLGLNKMFVEHANELLTDMPFLLCLCAALAGHEMLGDGQSGRRRWPAIALMATGLACGTLLRPTIVAVVAALGLACLWGILRGHRRRAHAISLTVLIAVEIAVAGAFLLAPQSRNLRQSYAQSLSTIVRKLEAAVAESLSNAPSDVDDQDRAGSGTPLGIGERIARSIRDVSNAVFHIRLGMFSLFVGALLLAYAIRLTRFNLVWGLLCPVTALFLAFSISVPRYYLMVLPLLLLGWLWHTEVFARAIPQRGGLRGGFILGAIALLLVPSLMRVTTLIMEQRCIAIESGLPAGVRSVRIIPWLPLVKTDFIQAYHDGRYAPIAELSRHVAQHVPPGQVILGPEPRIMTYLSRRKVVGPSQYARKLARGERLADVLARQRVRWAIWGPSAYAVARDNPFWDMGIWRLLRDQLPPPAVGPKVHGLYLAPYPGTPRPGANSATRNTSRPTSTMAPPSAIPTKPGIKSRPPRPMSSKVRNLPRK